MNRDENVIIIEAGQTERRYWLDLWRYRELFYILAWRDIIVRYRQTVIGILWALLRPIIAILIFTVVFGNFAKLPSEGVPYALLVCAGMLPWQFFATGFSEAGNSLVGSAALVSKVYFPRLIIPASAVIVSLVDLAVSLLILVVLVLWYGVIPDWRVLTLPLFVAIAFGASLGAGVWVAALNVKYRDFRYIVPFIVQFGLYISPVGFSSTIVPDAWQLIYALNPMVGVIDGFRWALLSGAVQLNWHGIGLSLFVVMILMLSGITYFRRTERQFADVI